MKTNIWRATRREQAREKIKKINKERKKKKNVKSFSHWAKTNIMGHNKCKVKNVRSLRPPNATIVLSFVLAFVCVTITAFNVDTVNYIRHEGEVDSMFGFSVALHQEQQRSWWVSLWVFASIFSLLAQIQQFYYYRLVPKFAQTK